MEGVLQLTMATPPHINDKIMNPIPAAARAAVLALLLCALSAASAGTLTVTNTNDNLVGSLRQAIRDANPGDTIVFSFGPINSGTIYLDSGELVIDKSLTIDGAGGTVTKFVVPPLAITG